MDNKKRNIVLLVITVVLIGLAVWAFWPPSTSIRKGLDIQGGLSVILTAEETSSTPVTAEAMSRAELIVQNRVNALGASEATVQKQGNDSILVQIPGIKNADEALEVLGSTGQLEFVEVDSIEDTTAVAAIKSGEQEVKLEPGTYEPFLTGAAVKKAGVVSAQNTGKPEVTITFNDEGKEAFASETARLAGTQGQIAIVLDGTVQSAPAVQSVISDGEVLISGNFTTDEAKNLQMVLESGALPVTLKFSESRVVGPTLGQESLKQGIFAAALGLGVVAIYLLCFYRGLGLITVSAMAIFAIWYLGVLAVLSRMGAFALSLPGVAGIVLTIGIAADSSVLILERFKEEIRLGRSVRAASITGVSHAIKTSIDADLVTIVSALSLFFIAVGPVKGFGLTLAIGIVCDIAVMLLYKAPLIRLIAPNIVEHHHRFWGIPEVDPSAKATNGKTRSTRASRRQAKSVKGGGDNE